MNLRIASRIRSEPSASIVDGVDRLLERDGDEALRGQVVDLVRPHAFDHAQDVGHLHELEIDQLDLWLDAELCQPPRVRRRGSPPAAIDLVAFPKEHFRR